jgi:hypothetical protein
VLGRPIELVIEDNQTTNPGVVLAFSKLAGDKDIFGSHARIASPLAGRLRHPERLFYKIGCDGKSGRGAAIGTMPNYAPRISAAGKW